LKSIDLSEPPAVAADGFFPLNFLAIPTYKEPIMSFSALVYACLREPFLRAASSSLFVLGSLGPSASFDSSTASSCF
jgi:hypothetical protein